MAYAAIIALQLRIIWNIWRYKDLVTGDSSSYFLDAASWTHGLHDDIIWSPLYTDVWGSVYALFHENVYASEIALRMAVVILASVLVLALMRSLLTPAVALIAAAWWTLVPANYNVLYEVHLFGLIPILLAVLVVAKRQTRGAVGVSLGFLLGIAMLLRNEILLTTAIVAAFVAYREIRGRWPDGSPQVGRTRAYGVPLLLVVALVGALYWRSFDQGHDAELSFKAKQGLNACQAYAFNYQQRHPTKFTGNAFTECQPLMRQVFGRAEPSFLSATTANPRAMAAFVAWNGRLLGSGLQVALFNATSTSDQPDYQLVDTGQGYALILSLLVLGLWIAGSVAIKQDWDYWRGRWLPPRRWLVIVLGAECVTTVAVALSERPRPEYMYALTVGLMALAGICADALLRRGKAGRVAAPAAVITTALLLLLVPNYYQPAARPLRERVQHLKSVQNPLQAPGSVLITGGYNFEVCAYLAATATRHCTAPDWSALESELAHGGSLKYVLDRAKATAIYVEPLLQSNPAIAQLVATPSAYGWREVAGGNGAEGPWQILIRSN